MKDPVLRAAMLAAPLFWAGLLAWNGTTADLAWPARAPGNFLLLAIVFPVLEELAFRGFVQVSFHKTSWGTKHWRGISGANVATSVIFAFAHFANHSPFWAAVTFFPSLVFGFFRDRYGRLMPSIILHIFYNTGYFWLFGSNGYST